MAEAVDRAYQTIRDGIVRGVYAQGSHITAQGLAETSGLSRTPVREAMRRLHSEGLIQIIPNRGAFVARWTEREIEQTYDLRVLLESYAAGLAAKNVTEAQLAVLRGLAEEMKALVQIEEPSVQAIADVNSRFHHAMLLACGNPRLHEMLTTLVEMPLVLSTFRHYSREELVRSANQHLELIWALEVRDVEWARNVMSAHILSARHTLVRYAHEPTPVEV
jgi:DNA-binding GntR family transcriptional regulator